jgi:uncharacterized membrane protein (UPF0127 family)
MNQGIASTGRARKVGRAGRAAAAGLVCFAFASLACSAEPKGGNRREPKPATLSAEVVIAGALIRCEVVDTPELRALGLSGRAGLPPGEGMLFVFEKADRHSFWMKGMSFDIDILWIDLEKVVHIARAAAPKAGDQLATYRPEQSASYVLEVVAGTAESRGWVVGSPVGIRGLDP